MTDLFMQGVGAMRAGRLEEAEATYRRLLQGQPDHVGALNLLAQIRFKHGDLEESTALLQRARAAAPAEADTHYNLGLVLRAQNRLRDAIAAYREAIRLRPDHVSAQANLAGALLDDGHAAQAAEAAERGLRSQPRHPLLLHNRGMALWQLGHADEAIEALKLAADAAPGFALAHANLGRCLNARGRTEEAIAAYRRALAADPDHEHARAGLAEALHQSLPAWHFPMLADRRRNEVYRHAIEAAVRPGMLVLDIGTGTGLLAMMAARAGAGQVVACEVEPRLAEIAREIVAKNGLERQITVLARKSTELAAGRDLPRRADLVVSEILDSALIGEGVIPTMRHALVELAAPDAAVIPTAAVMRGALVALPDLRAVNPVAMIEGFDLSPFDRFRNRNAGVPVDLQAERHQLLGPAADLFGFDFAQAIATPRERIVAFRADGAGTAHGIALWYELTLHGAFTASTGPGGDLRHWKPTVHFLERDVALSAGQEVALVVGHDDGGWWVRFP